MKLSTYTLTTREHQRVFVLSKITVRTRSSSGQWNEIHSVFQTLIHSSGTLVWRSKRFRWELTSESLHESFINSRVLVKREQELHASWQARVYMRVSSTLVSWSNENKRCMRVDKREFRWEFHQHSCPGQTRTRVARELTSESLHESFINCHVLVKREQELVESWQARVCMGVSSTLMSWSNENKSGMRVDKARVCMRVSSTLVSWSNENKGCSRVDKREFAWEFHQLSCPGQTRARVGWELTSESLHGSFINSHVLIKREQELHESWQSESLHESSINSHVLVKREQELHESWQAKVCMRVSSTLMFWSNENKSWLRVDKPEFACMSELLLSSTIVFVWPASWTIWQNNETFQLTWARLIKVIFLFSKRTKFFATTN